MANINIAPTKSNLLIIKEQLSVAQSGYELLEQKREILVMELMKLVEDVKLLEREIDKTLQEAYPAVKRMLMIVGADRVERVAHHTKYNFTITEKPVISIAYPFGDYDDNTILASKEAGYSLSFNTNRGLSDRTDNPLSLNRIYVSSLYSIEQFKEILESTEK